VHPPFFSFTHLLSSFHGPQLKPSSQIRDPLYQSVDPSGKPICDFGSDTSLFFIESDHETP
ncbi:hypothetical protein, partial [Duganella violaceipulchra]